MGLLSFLASAAGGTVLGGITQLLGTFASEAKEWSASKRRIAELTAMKERDIAIGELQAFTKAQEASISSGYTPPETASAWMHGLFTIVEALTRIIRPALVIWAAFYIFNLPASVAGPLQPEIVAVAFACIYFLLCVRHQGKK